MKSIKLMSLGLVMFSAVALGAPAAHAVDPVASSNADVKFVEDDSAVDPNKPEVVDPTKPTEPGKEVKPGGEGNGGNGTKSFNINWVSNFKFGEIKIGSSTMRAFAAPTTLNWEGDPTPAPTENLANFLQVTDNRGTNAGWNVSVQGTPFFELDDQSVVTTNQLAGASITLNNANVVGDSENAALAPVAMNTNVDILGTNAPYTVFNAAANKGQGTWTVNWGAEADGTTLKQTNGIATDGVQLSVPVTAQPKANKNYRSTLTWTLAATPAN